MRVISTPLFSCVALALCAYVALTSIASAQTLQEVRAKINGMQAVPLPPEAIEVSVTSLLRQGHTGQQVSVLQAILASDADIYPEGAITGYFGPATVRALKRFQAKNNLDQVGFVGPRTHTVLRATLVLRPLGFSAVTKTICSLSSDMTNFAQGWLRKNDGINPIVKPCQGVLDIQNPLILQATVRMSGTIAHISWTTNELTNSQVNYGTTPELGNTIRDGQLTTRHMVDIPGLSAETLYYFAVSSSDASGNGATTALMTFKIGSGLPTSSSN